MRSFCRIGTALADKGGITMCIAVYSPKGVDIPSKDILYNCFVNNPDGTPRYENTIQYAILNHEWEPSALLSAYFD